MIGVVAFMMFMAVGGSGLLLFAGIFLLIGEVDRQVKRKRKPKVKRKNAWLQ
jgi:hypothetical protein